jgi:hypothetical protein
VKKKLALWRLQVSEEDFNKGGTGMAENGPSQMRHKENVIKKWRRSQTMG